MRLIKKAKLAFSRDITMANLFDYAARVYGGQDMIVLDHPLRYGVVSGDEFSYQDMARLSSHMAHALSRLGVGRGERVIICPSNGIDVPLLAG
ncbi:MAG: hypothetical protein ACOC78_01005, partial [Actinomycetota bacterium]